MDLFRIKQESDIVTITHLILLQLDDINQKFQTKIKTIITTTFKVLVFCKNIFTGKYALVAYTEK